MIDTKLLNEIEKIGFEWHAWIENNTYYFLLMRGGEIIEKLTDSSLQNLSKESTKLLKNILNKI